MVRNKHLLQRPLVRYAIQRRFINALLIVDLFRINKTLEDLFLSGFRHCRDKIVKQKSFSRRDGHKLVATRTTTLFARDLCLRDLQVPLRAHLYELIVQRQNSARQIREAGHRAWQRQARAD